jgi:hypothetical protein
MFCSDLAKHWKRMFLVGLSRGSAAACWAGAACDGEGEAMDAKEGRDPAAGGDARVAGRLAGHMSERQRLGVTCSFGETA